MSTSSKAVPEKPLALVAADANRYTEGTLEYAGWYYFYPANPTAFERPKFVELDQRTIDDGDLHCRRYAGVYIGPIIPPH